MKFLALAVLLVANAASEPLSVDSARRAPTLRVVGGPAETPLPLEFVNFLLDHPEMAAWFARERGIARYSVDRNSAQMHTANDHQGARGRVERLERSERYRLYYGEGEYNPKALPTILAGAAVELSLSTAVAPGCPETTSTRYEVNLRLNSRVLSGVAQPLAPWLRGVIAKKFDRAFTVARKIGVLLSEDPVGAGAQLAQYPQLAPEDKAELERLLKRLPPRPANCL